MQIEINDTLNFNVTGLPQGLEVKLANLGENQINRLVEAMITKALQRTINDAMGSAKAKCEENGFEYVPEAEAQEYLDRILSGEKGTRTSNPLESEAKKVARELLKAKGHTKPSKEQVAQVAANPKVREIAQSRLAALQDEFADIEI